MAKKFNKFLGDMLTGFLAPKGNLADFQHASRLFVDDTFRLAPKNKFLYYVVFNISPDALTDVSFQDRHRLELNYLVKNAELPKYSIKTETLNQYNRHIITVYKRKGLGVNFKPSLKEDELFYNGITEVDFPVIIKYTKQWVAYEKLDSMYEFDWESIRATE
jgi:hypothetical protein